MNENLSIYSLGSSEDEPIISSADMLSGSGLTPMANGKIEGYDYHILSDSTGKVMMFITLIRNTELHVIAIGGKSGLSRHVTTASRRKWLEPVRLEGDFSEDFHVYCTKGRQMEVRQVFAPDTMVDFQDFCQAYNFELYKDSIYISQAQGAADEQDDTTMVTDVINFVTQNKRLLARL